MRPDRTRIPALLRGCLAAAFAFSFGSPLLGSDENAYSQTVLVANRPDYHPVAFVDRYLVNPWGIALRPPGIGGHIWVSNAANATTTLYIGDVNGKPLFQDGLKMLGIEGPKVSYEDGVPNVTGQV